MKKLLTLFLSAAAIFGSQAQTTVYTTGQSYADAWTGWSSPVVTGISSSSVNGANIYTFSGMSGASFTVETYRQFVINSNDIDIYLSATTQNATISVEFSTDNVSYTSIGSLVFGSGFSLSTLVIPAYDPVVTTFYLKLKMTGTFGSPSQTNFNSLKIDAVLNSTNAVSVTPSSTQNLLTATNGTVLSATESPSAASSREWKYSTTSGSGYVAFSPAQTGLTYTPNFATAGTYYVVCVSDFSGDVQTSNQVQINVTAPATVEEFALGSSVIYGNSLLQINTSLQNYSVQVFDLNGQVLVSEQNLKHYDFSAHDQGIYFVTFWYNGDRKTVKVAHLK